MKNRIYYDYFIDEMFEIYSHSCTLKYPDEGMFGTRNSSIGITGKLYIICILVFKPCH